MSTATVSARSLAAHRRAEPIARTRLRLTRRGRVVVTLLAALPVIGGVAFGVLNGGQASAGSTQTHVHFQHVTIEPGETLWQLATEEAPSSDPRAFVQDVITLNDLPSAAVQAGQRLAIPTRYASGS